MTTPTATDADRYWMSVAIGLSWECPHTENAYAVGAVIANSNGGEISRGYSRETDPKVHAEESALNKISGDDVRLDSATLYSTLEPCSQRASRPRTCTQLILATRIQRVVIAWREPSLFVADCQGVELLEQAGLQVIELHEFAEEARAVNAHLKFDK